MKDIRSSVAAAVTALLIASLAPVSTALGETPPGSVEQGKRAYMEKMCNTCHGTVGQGGERGAGPRIAPNPFPFEGFALQVRRPRAVMPRYPVEFLSDREMADIYAYVASVKPGRKASEISLLRD